MVGACEGFASLTSPRWDESAPAHHVVLTAAADPVLERPDSAVHPSARSGSLGMMTLAHSRSRPVGGRRWPWEVRAGWEQGLGEWY